ncbi:LOW QUALITY PROTEIN: actin-related protein 5 [Bacillus rossius redtenbacheri]|uniref:LOW QUALITY PROTEIN: actin-related protein 5 n=1 Tax=Bacillus rossius redtenbacheri TaxID=93214 RepID=UPI002FDE1BFB
MTTLELKDIKVIPDVIHPYSDCIKNSSTAIVIDNGSYQSRVGWACNAEPLLIFKNLIAKPRKERGKKEGENQVGNDITNIEAVRFQLKSQFDRNVVTHFEAQEQVFDYTFTHLGIDTEGSVNHPILITEAFLNPNYSRQLMSELLFECYGVPGLAYGVDALFSHRLGAPEGATGLVVSCGHHATHVLPVVGGRADPGGARRVNVGGAHVAGYLHRLLQLKYPAHFNAITLSRAELLVHEQCYVAEDYQQELRRWGDPDHYERHVRRIQLPWAAPAPAPGLAPEQQRERRRELARRLVEINARKREERLAEDEEQLNQLLAAQDLLEEGEEEEFQNILDSYELSSIADLQKLITTLQARIERTRQKIVAANTADESITEEPKSKSVKQILKPKDQEDFDLWIENVKQKRQDILDRRNARRQRRQDMAKRHTAAAQMRMKIISQLARKEKRDDNFGMRDEDWDVYKVINKEGGDSDSDDEQRLLELEEVLRRHDPEFEGTGGAGAGTSADTAETHQLHVGIERIRAPEILFQPSMVGSAEAGIAETVEHVLRRYPPETQALLVASVFLTGGCATLPGLVARMTKELREIRPFRSSFKVVTASNPVLDAWHGARAFAASQLDRYLVTRQEYDERGGEFFKEHLASNAYVPSPTPLPLPETAPVAACEDIEVDIF